METVQSADGTTIAYDRTGDGPERLHGRGSLATTYQHAAER